MHKSGISRDFPHGIYLYTYCRPQLYVVCTVVAGLMSSTFLQCLGMLQELYCSRSMYCNSTYNTCCMVHAFPELDRNSYSYVIHSQFCQIDLLALRVTANVQKGIYIKPSSISESYSFFLNLKFCVFHFARLLPLVNMACSSAALQYASALSIYFLASLLSAGYIAPGISCLVCIKSR
jgi:hypothetical protein